MADFTPDEEVLYQKFKTRLSSEVAKPWWQDGVMLIRVLTASAALVAAGFGAWNNRKGADVQTTVEEVKRDAAETKANTIKAANR